MRFAGFATSYYQKNTEEQFLGTHIIISSQFSGHSNERKWKPRVDWLKMTSLQLSKSSRWQCAGITKIRLTISRMKMSRADRNPWLAKMFVGGFMSYLHYLCLLVYSSVKHILCCVLFFFVLCTLCCKFLWIVHFWLPLWYSLTFNFTVKLLGFQ